MNNIDFANKLENIAKNFNTLYVRGCFGSPLTASNKRKYSNYLEYNQRADRSAMINAATSNTFGFDCVCLIKGVLWGWSGDKTKTYGGAKYKSNNVPDIGADQMIKVCTGVTTDFSDIEIGEAVWTEGHIGVYIGNGLAVECTPKWDNCVQITACNCTKNGYHRRTWKKHGKLPYINYVNDKTTNTEEVCTVEINVLKKGAKGDQVKALQTLLIGYGYSCGNSGVDGSFGTATTKAVKAYQKAEGLKVDGCVGPATWGKLLGVN